MSLNSVLAWPSALRPAQIQPNPVSFTRSGPRSLNGISRRVKTDRGYWVINYIGVPLMDEFDRRAWNALRTGLNGAAGLISIPVWSFELINASPEVVLGQFLSTFSDTATFGDGSQFSQPSGPYVSMDSDAAIGDTVVNLRVDDDTEDLTGMRFSYNHALYEIGFRIGGTGNIWQVPIFPAIRAPIPADATLVFNVPRCLVRLVDDRQMDQSVNYNKFDLVNVSFVEAVDYWNDLAVLGE